MKIMSTAKVTKNCSDSNLENKKEDEKMEEIIEKRTTKKTIKKRCIKIYKNISLYNCY